MTHTIEQIIVPLGGNIVGIICPLEEGGMDRVLEHMSNILSQYDFLPPNVMRGLDIADHVLDLPNPKKNRFDFAIPVRKVDDRRNCAKWNHSTHEWVITPFRLKMPITGENVMMVASVRHH